jgi:hypothetical protein
VEISTGVQEGVDVTEKEDIDYDDDHLPLSDWVQKVGCGILGHYDYTVYATIDSNIVMAETQTKRFSENWETRMEKKQKNQKRR